MLKQNGKFESLHWFDSLTDEFKEQERQLNAARVGQKDSDDMAQVSTHDPPPPAASHLYCRSGSSLRDWCCAQHSLRMRKLRNRKAEFDLLYYAFNGARIFFRGEGAKVVAPTGAAPGGD